MQSRQRRRPAPYVTRVDGHLTSRSNAPRTIAICPLPPFKHITTLSQYLNKAVHLHVHSINKLQLNVATLRKLHLLHSNP